MGFNLAPRWMMGNVIGNRSGDVSVSFLMPTANISHRDDSERLSDYQRWCSIYAFMPGPFTHQSVERRVPMRAIYQRAAAAAPGGDMKAVPLWDEKTFETLEDIAGWDDADRPVEKLTLLTVTLPELSVSPLQASRRPSRSTLERVMSVSAEFLTRLRVLYPAAEPASEGFLRWMYGYASSFGGIEPDYTEAVYNEERVDSADSATLVPLLGCGWNERGLRVKDFAHSSGLRKAMSGSVSIASRVVGDGMLNESHGGYECRSCKSRYPASRPPRDLKMCDDPSCRGRVAWDDGDVQTVHQAVFVANDAPQSWWYPEGSLTEFLSRLDFVVRVALVGRPVSDKKALMKLERIFKSLSYMGNEAAGDAAPTVELENSWRAAHRQYEELTATHSVTMPTSILVSIGASSEEELEARCRRFKDLLDPANLRFIRPVGLQTDLWAAMLPGARTPALVREHERQLMPHYLAGYGLFHGQELGDGVGRVWGYLDDCPGPRRLVYRLVTLGPTAGTGNTGSVIANVGDQGAGKSLDLKELAHDNMSLGGGLAVIDTTADLEWVRAVAAWGVPGRVSAVVFGEGSDVLDPLRVFCNMLPSEGATGASGLTRSEALAQAEKHTLGYLSILFGIAKEDDDRYALLTAGVQSLLDPDSPLVPSLPNLLLTLEYWLGVEDLPVREIAPGVADKNFVKHVADVQPLTSLVRRMKILARRGDVGKQMFGDGKPLDLTDRVIIFGAPEVEVDDAAGRAFMYLAGAYCLRYLSATPRFNLVALSEVKTILSDDFGRRLMDQLLRQSRRRFGGVLVDTQMASDLVDAGLVLQRTLGRTKDAQGAEVGLRWQGFRNPSPALVSTVQKLTNATKVFMDAQGRTGVVLVMRTPNEARFQAARTGKKDEVSAGDLGYVPVGSSAVVLDSDSVGVQ